MTAATVARHRTRKMAVSGHWNVQVQAIKGLWHSAGTVWQVRSKGGYWEALWGASSRGMNLGIHPTKRAAVQAVVDAEAGIGS